jgi:hypothetical protein
VLVMHWRYSLDDDCTWWCLWHLFIYSLQYSIDDIHCSDGRLTVWSGIWVFLHSVLYSYSWYYHCSEGWWLLLFLVLIQFDLVDAIVMIWCHCYSIVTVTLYHCGNFVVTDDLSCPFGTFLSDSCDLTLLMMICCCRAVVGGGSSSTLRYSDLPVTFLHLLLLFWYYSVDLVMTITCCWYWPVIPLHRHLLPTNYSCSVTLLFTLLEHYDVPDDGDLE